MAASVQDYYQIYKDVNHVTRAVPSAQCSEVTSIQRMYFKLDMLDVELLTQPDIVKELVVFADVVEVEGHKVTLPAFSKVTIVCRILHVKKDDVQLEFKFLGPVVCRGLLSDALALIFAGSPEVQLSIHAQQVLCNNSTALLRVRHPVKVYELISFDPPWLDQLTQGTIEWRVAVSSNDLSAAQHSYQLRTERTGNVHESEWHIKEEEWSPFISVLTNIDSIPIETLTDPNVMLGMQSTLLIAELVLNYQTDVKDTVSAAAEHVQWLATNLLQVMDDNALDNETTQELLALLARAQVLSKLPHDGNHTLIVPRLEYTQYQGLIQSMASVAEVYDNEFRQINLFIQQNEVLGSYLLQQNKAFAEREKEMEVFHGLVITRRREELRAADERMEVLDAQLTQQTKAMDQAKEDMDNGLKRYRDEQIARAFFAVLKGVLEIGAAIFTGGATAGFAVQGAVSAVNAVNSLRGALDMVLNIMQGMEKLMEFLNAVKDLTTSISELGQMVEAPAMPGLPSMMEWDIFENEIEEVAESMPVEVTEARTWRTKCKNVAAVCREITTTAAYIGELQYELFVHTNHAEIARRQAERLESIEPANMTNYLEMATQLDMRTSRILLDLLRVFSLQNAALLFHFLLPPTPFSGWVTMGMVRTALVKHEADALVARERLGYSTDFTRTYVVSDIPLSILLEGDDWIFVISPEDSIIPLNWSRVRIRYLEMKFSGGEEFHKPTTNSGKVYILLQASRTFHDRLRGDVLHYEAAVPLRYQYAYVLETGETTVSNRPSQQHNGEFMQMTPFCQWRLRLSASALENQGLEFPTASADLDSCTTQISITFYLTAIRAIDLFRQEDEV